MSFLEQILGGGSGQSSGRPGLGSTVAAGVVLALLVKAVRASQQHGGTSDPRSFAPAGEPGAQASGGLLGNLGGDLGGLASLLSGGGMGQVLGGLGGAGALGALVQRFHQTGLGQQANSWVSSGPNQPVAPSQIEQTLGADVVNELQQKTSLPRDPLLQELSRLLPQAISEATPEGRLPTDAELHQIARPGG